MCMKANRRFTFWEGWYDFIRDLETDEEKLEAYQTICQMAFLGEEGYDCPEKPADGTMTPTLKVRRQVYHMLHGSLWRDSTKTPYDRNTKSSKCSEASYGRGRPLKGESKDDYIKRTDINRLSRREEEAPIEESPDMLPESPVAHDWKTVGQSPSPQEKALETASDPLPVRPSQKSMWAERFKTKEDLRKFLRDLSISCSKPAAMVSDDFVNRIWFMFAEVQHWHNNVTNKPFEYELVDAIRGEFKRFLYGEIKDRKFERKLAEVKQAEEAEEKDKVLKNLTEEDLEELRLQRQKAIARKGTGKKA